MLATIYKMWFLPLILILFTSQLVKAQESPSIPAMPVWEKINGQWSFNKNNKSSHQILLHITTTKYDNKNKNLLIKELVKLPFIIYSPEIQKGTTPLEQ